MATPESVIFNLTVKPGGGRWAKNKIKKSKQYNEVMKGKVGSNNLILPGV